MLSHQIVRCPQSFTVTTVHVYKAQSAASVARSCCDTRYEMHWLNVLQGVAGDGDEILPEKI